MSSLPFSFFCAATEELFEPLTTRLTSLNPEIAFMWVNVGADTY